MRIKVPVLVLAAVAALLVGCGEGSKETNVTVDRQASKTSSTSTAQFVPRRCRPAKGALASLDSYSGPENVGVLIAKQRGFFADAGLHVRVLGPAFQSKPVDYVAAGVDDVAVAHLPQVMVAKDMGVPLVVVGSVISQPTTSMIWLKSSKIRSIAELKGKTIATAGIPFQESLLGEVLERAGLTLADVKVEHVGYRLVPTLLKGKADAIFGGSWNIEGVALKKRGVEPVVKRVQNLGAPPYDELVVIARAKCIAQYPQVARRFMAALDRGTAAAIENPASALKVIEEGIKPDPEATRKITRAEIKATFPLLSKTGRIDAATTARLAKWMHERGLIQHKLAVSELLTNSYAPKAAAP